MVTVMYDANNVVNEVVFVIPGGRVHCTEYWCCCIFYYNSSELCCGRVEYIY